MKAKIQKWGNSLALRIPRPLADELGLDRDSLVELTMTRRTLVVKPAMKSHLVLDELLDRVTKENIHAEVNLGPPEGRESW
jgi:antitoxin MazE